MTEAQFWESIAQATVRSPSGSHWPLREHLVDVLSPLPKQDLAAWERFFGRKMDECYDGVLWKALVLIDLDCHHCMDDSFRDFRETLIVCGREVYEAVVTNPDVLIDHRFLLEYPEIYFFGCAQAAWHLQFPDVEDPDELDELNEDDVVFEDRLIRPFPKFEDLPRLLPGLSSYVRENDPKYWKKMRDHANEA